MKLSIKLFKRFSICCAVLFIVACGSAGVKKDGDGAEKPKLLDTTVYLPVQEYDEKNGVYLPYEAEENPYTSDKSRINKEVITTFIQAKRDFKSKNFSKAIGLLDQIIAQDDSLSGPWEMKGDIALIKNDRDKALEFYQKAKEVNAKNVNVYIKLAKLQREDGKFIVAQNTLTDALVMWRDFPEAHLNIGILYDVYLNHPLRAQKHMEAYVFLVEEPEPQAVTWLNEVKSRTGIKDSPYHKTSEEGAAVGE